MQLNHTKKSVDQTSHFILTLSWVGCLSKFNPIDYYCNFDVRIKIRIHLLARRIVVGDSKAPEQPQSSARPICHSHTMMSMGRKLATIHIAAYIYELAVLHIAPWEMGDCVMRMGCSLEGKKILVIWVSQQDVLCGFMSITNVKSFMHTSVEQKVQFVWDQQINHEEDFF